MLDSPPHVPHYAGMVAQSVPCEGRGEVKLTFLYSNSYTGTCPTIYATDRGSFVVQGTRVTDPEALAAMGLPAHETAVEVPFDLLAAFAVGQLTARKES
jgi:hypothetical protein